jgi:hypothetical protein
VIHCKQAYVFDNSHSHRLNECHHVALFLHDAFFFWHLPSTNWAGFSDLCRSSITKCCSAAAANHGFDKAVCFQSNTFVLTLSPAQRIGYQRADLSMRTLEDVPVLGDVSRNKRFGFSPSSSRPKPVFWPNTFPRFQMKSIPRWTFDAIALYAPGDPCEALIDGFWTKAVGLHVKGKRVDIRAEGVLGSIRDAVI